MTSSATAVTSAATNRRKRFEGICSARGHFNEVTSATQKGFSTDMTTAAYYPQVFLFTAGGHPLSQPGVSTSLRCLFARQTGVLSVTGMLYQSTATPALQ